MADIFASNIIRALRNARTFDPSVTPQTSAMDIVTSTPEDEDLAPYDIDARLAQLYHPEHDALDRFEASIGRQQMRANNRPILERRITVELIAGMDPVQGREYLDRPYPMH